MAAPAVTGVVALVRERHPDWTPAQIRAALIDSAVPSYADSNATVEASPLRTGGGFVDAAGAVAPGVLADPPVLGFGLRAAPASSATVPVSISDAGDGAGVWQVTIDRHGGSPAGRRRSCSERGGGARGGRSAAARDADRRRRLPAMATRRATWCSRRARARGASRTGAHVERPHLAGGDARDCCRTPGIVRGSTRGQPNRVDRYRYPAYTGALGLPVRWRGGEALYRFHLAKRAINVGVTVEPISGGGLRPFVMRGARREPPRGGVRHADRRRPVADGGSGAERRPLLGAGRRLRGLRRLREASRRRVPAALLDERRHAARARATARLGRRADAAHPGDRRGLGRRSALPRVRAGASRAPRPTTRAVPTGTLGRASQSIAVGRLAAGSYALAVRVGDYAESRDALAIAISPQHVRTRVIGLSVNARGAIHVAPAPREAAFDARRQVDGA